MTTPLRFLLFAFGSFLLTSSTFAHEEISDLSPLRQITHLAMHRPDELDRILRIEFKKSDYLIRFGATGIVKKNGAFFLRLFDNYSDNWKEEAPPTFLAPLYFAKSPQELADKISKYLSLGTTKESTIVIIFSDTITVVTSGENGMDGTQVEKLIYSGSD